jgi:hypothetical protein
MMTGQLAIQFRLQPLSGFMVLTIGAMAVAAASIYHVPFATLVALIDTGAVMIRSAVDDSIDDFSMFSGNGITETLDILGRIALKDVFNCCHGHLLSSDR